MTGRAGFWCWVAVTTAIYALMLGWSLPRIAEAAGGLRPFDMRPAGYSYAEAQAFLTALTPDGARFYTGVQHWLDTAYPLLLAVMSGWAMARLTRWWRSPVRSGLWLVPLPAMAFDWLENAAVAGMIRVGVQGITPDMVAQASLWSRLKAGATTLSLTLLLALIVIFLIRQSRRAA